MKLASIISILLCLTAAGLSGCYTTVDGGRKTGLPWMKDTIEGRYQRPVEDLYLAALEVLRFNGTIVNENRVNKALVAKINETTVYVQIEAVGPKVSRVLVQSRTRFGRPNIDISSELEKQIALRLK